MKLDPRIILQTDILTCFDTERAEQFVGQKGYFTDCLNLFKDVATLKDGVLEKVADDDGRPFLRKGDIWWRFFIPESSLKPKEKKYRPYIPEEFCDKFQIGQPIKFRNKGDEGSERYGDLQGLWYKRRDGKTIAYVIIESNEYALEELFNDFEWRALFQGGWRPFGVEVEE